MMTVDEVDAHAPAAGNGEGPASIRLRWVSVPEAARLLGISEVAVRKRLTNRSLTGLRAGRGWKVLLAGEPGPVSAKPVRDTGGQPESPPDDTVRVLARTSEALEALIRDVQRQSLALSAQVGYLQSQLAEAQKQVRLLTERNEAAVDHEPPGPSRVEYEAAHATIAALRTALEEARKPAPGSQAAPRGRGWRLWRRR